MKNAIFLIAFILISFCAYYFDFSFLPSGNTGTWIIIFLILALCFSISSKFRPNFVGFKIIVTTLFVTVIFTFVFNLILDSFDDAVLYTIRLLAMAIFSLIFCSLFGLERLKNALKTIVFSKSAKISIDIAFSLIPQLTNWSRQFKLSIESKGAKLTVQFILKNSQIITNAYLNMMFNKLSALELSLRSKGV